MGLISSVAKLFGQRTEEAPEENPKRGYRSTEDLQRTLIDIVNEQMRADMLRRVAADPSDTKRAQANMRLGITLTENKIKALKRDTMFAMIRAAAHPTYSVPNALRKDSGMAEDETQVRDVALYFDVLRKSRKAPSSYGTALGRLRAITQTDDQYSLMRTNPKYGRAMLQLVLHFSTKFEGPLDMDNGLRKMVKDEPQTYTDIINYAKQRGITKLELITKDALLEWQKTTPALRDGAL